MLRGYWLPAIAIGLVLAGAANAQPVGRHASHQHGTTTSQPKPQSDLQPSAPIAVQNNIERIARALESSNAKKPSAADQKYAADNLETQREMARAANRMFYVGLFEAFVTAMGVFLIYRTLFHTRRAVSEAKRAADAAENSVTETRRIGEAQVRAYVKIKAVTVFFLDNWVPNDAYPNVQIVAQNTGQSSALNFVWQATIQYVSGNQRRQRELGGNWADMLGVTISAGDDLSEAAVIADMPMVQFATSANSPSNTVLVRVRIDFAFTDVFDRKITGEAYFADVASTYNTVEGPKWGNAPLSPLHKLRDWDDAGTFQNQ